MTQTIFCQTIENMMLQSATDKRNAELIAEIFPSTETSLYDNSLYVKSIIALLHEHFPRNKEGFSSIEHYIFDCGFGKMGSEGDWETPEALFKRLTIEKRFNQIYQ
ncbi:MAG: hypothetical protein KBC56_04790 [Flavobacterium sp.]|nr:hypothetical protein [Flavobacterium sp.]